MAETPLGLPSARAGAGVLVAAAEHLAWPLAVIAVVAFGAFLRFDGVDWDVPPGSSVPLQMHPDERFISIVNAKIRWPSGPGEYFDTGRSPLNPYNQPETPSFVYGTFPIFATKAVATAAGSDVPVVSDAASLFCKRDGYDSTVMCGRRLTALVDTLTILLVVALGVALANRAVGLVGGFLYAAAVLPIQLSHFWTVDPYVVFFGVATVLLSVLWMKERSSGPEDPGRPGARAAFARTASLAAGIGACIGLGLASKVTAWPLLIAPILALATRAGLRDLPRLGLSIRGSRAGPGGHWSFDLVTVSAAFLVALLVFRLAQPYAFAGPNAWDVTLNAQWRADIEREIDFQNGNVDFPPFVQFAGRTPLLWPLQNMALWGLGPFFAAAAALGLAVAAVSAARRREVTWLIPLAVVAAILAFQGLRFVAYMRYFVPAYPFLALFAAMGISWLVDVARTRDRAGRPRLSGWSGRGSPAWRRAALAAALAFAVAVPAATAWWALAFASMLREPHPRIAASEWIYGNIPPGSAITTEVWDDSLPYSLGGMGPGRYRLVNTFPFDTDSVAKVVTLVYGSEGPAATPGLNGADYVIVASDRARTAVRRLEREYPATIRYYELLDSGELGFDLVAEFEVRPSFLGIRVDDSEAEESFTVYDHPVVRIYRKSERWDPLRAANLLFEAGPDQAVNLLPRQGRTNGLQFTSSEWARVQASGTFAEVFSDATVFARAPAAWWFAWVEVLALASVPWVTWLLRRLPDRGYGLTKVIGFAASGLATWMIVAWGAAEFSQLLAWGVAAAFVATGLAAGVMRRRDLAAELRTRWRLWLACETVFAAAFLAFLALRLQVPDLWHNFQGGEKPVELAFLTAVTRSATMPPYDPWFAGGTMNYYYMGWFLVAVPMRAMRILPEVGFNLAIPTYAALAAATAFSTAANLVALGRRASQRLPVGRAIGVGALGALLLVGIGNLDAGHQAVQRLQSLNLAGYDAQGQPVYHWDFLSGTPVFGGAVGLASGIYRWLFESAALPPFDWWRPSRVHAPAFDITEFPYFSFLFGDLHAHLMGIPILGLVIALCLAYVVSAGREGARTWFIAAALGIALGLVRTVHTWDFPTSVLLVLAAIAAGQLLRNDRPSARFWDGAGHAVVAILVLVVAFAPYTARNEVFETGIVRARETTKANQYFAHFGLFVVLAVAFLAVRYHEEVSARPHGPGRNPILALVSGRWEVFSLAVFALGLAVFSWRWGLTTIALSALLLVFFANLLWLEVRAREPNMGRLFATAAFFAAIGIAGGIDVVQVRYDIVRMNTVFKFSLQAWQLYALGGAYALWYVSSAIWTADAWFVRAFPGRRMAAAAFGVSLAILAVGSTLYLWSGTRARLEARFPGSPTGTLDGLAYLQHGYFVENRGNQDPADDVLLLLRDDEPLIRWLRENVEGTPVVAEAVGPLYHWTSRIAWNTGLPTVVGWDWHEVAYRTDYEQLVQRRRFETARFYNDPSERVARDYLRKYGVAYVVVGITERALSSPEGLAKFETMPELRPVFRFRDNVIYEVDRASLGPPTISARPP